MQRKTMMSAQWKRTAFLAFITAIGAHRMSAQPPDPTQVPPSTAQSTGQSSSASGQFDRPISWKLLIPNLIGDQKKIWSFPVNVAEGHSLVPAAAILGATAGLVLFDPTEAPYFRRSTTFHAFNNIFSSNATAVGTIVAPVAFYGIGLLRKDAKMQHTALLAGEAVADAELVATVLKDATKRVRPQGISGNNFYDSWFESGGSVLRGNGSFPSGHAIAAFSVATVVARRYGKHRWVPYVCYGAAALVGFSRLTLSAHFLSDVFMGGALGYSISRFAVLRQ